MSYHLINRYGFSEVTMFEEPGTPAFGQRIERHQATLHDVLPRMGDIWEHEWLPRIVPGVERARDGDLTVLDDDALIAEFDGMLDEFLDRYVVHGMLNFVTVSASMFADFYNEAFSPDDPTEAYQLLGGYPTRSVDAGRGLWALGRAISESDALRDAFESTDAADLPARLDEFPEGQAFASSLTEYLDEFGWRSDVFEMADPMWREDPTIPLNTLQGYIGLDDSHDPEVRYRSAVELRERLMAQARERLADEPERLGQFNSMHEAARHYLTLTEDHNFWIDQVGNGVMRAGALEFGRRLAERGAIDSADDVFWLYLAEIREGLQGTDQRALVTDRRAENERWAAIVPPPFIGEPPPPSGDPFEAAMMKMFGEPAEPSAEPNVITGAGASAGTVQGTVRVVTDLSQASKVREGDVMVCEMTMPAWTPLFSIASAVVADTGGVLSHCAIVSREYGMPCVVGTAVGTSVLQDGMLVTVDGSKGIVRIDAR
jgi:pyruvate,water dikinase